MIKKALAAKPSIGKRLLKPLARLMLLGKIPFGIVEDFKIQETEAEAHKIEGDLWLCLEGKAEFICGGQLVRPWVRKGSRGNELAGKDIRGGKRIILKSGDWLWIPPGEPHLHWAKLARLVIVKVPQKK